MTEKTCQTCKWWYRGSLYEPPHCAGEECPEDTYDNWEEPTREDEEEYDRISEMYGDYLIKEGKV